MSADRRLRNLAEDDDHLPCEQERHATTQPTYRLTDELDGGGRFTEGNRCSIRLCYGATTSYFLRATPLATPRPVSRCVSLITMSSVSRAFPAWKHRETSEGLGPTYRANLWYGSVGWLHERSHYEQVATDTSGHAVGRWLFDSDVSLSAVHLEGRAATPGLTTGN